MLSATPPTFIVGFSLDSISTDVNRDLGWKRVRLGVWRDEEDREVRYLRGPRDLDGSPEGTRVYFAPGYDQRENWWEIAEAIQQRSCERVYL